MPKNGWLDYRNYQKLSLGEYLPTSTTVYFGCIENHVVEDAKVPEDVIMHCLSGNWTRNIPDCVPRCNRKFITGVTIELNECILERATVDCTDLIKPGTIVRLGCRDRYQRTSFARHQILSCGIDGAWTGSAQACNAVCGVEPTYVKLDEDESMASDRLMIPWHVGVYRFNNVTYNRICSGTIINARVILSVMRCFWDQQESKLLDKSLFRIATGKTLFNSVIAEGKQNQTFQIEDIFFDESFLGMANNYMSDIAIVVLKESITFNSHIGPICLPYEFPNTDILAGWTGQIPTWGSFNNEKESNNSLNFAEISAINRTQCMADAPNQFEPLITPNKFCAGNVSIAKEDIGSGLVFKQKEGDRNVYYLRAAVSTELAEQASKISVFTDYFVYSDLVSMYQEQYTPT